MKGERKRDRNIAQTGNRITHAETREWIHNPGLCYDKELNPQPFGYGMMLQPLSHTGQSWNTFLKNIFYWLCYYSCPIFPLYSPPPCAPPPTYILPPFVHVHELYIYKFFGFYISYTILNLPLSIFYLPFMLLIFCTFSLPLSTHSPADNPPCDLHFCDSVSVLFVCLVCFCFYFCFRCGC